MESELFLWIKEYGPVVAILGLLVYVLYKENKQHEQAYEKVLREMRKKDDERDQEMQAYWEEKEERYLQVIEHKDSQIIEMQSRAISTYEKMTAALDRLTDKLNEK